ncbi:universal stress protein [Streptosporangium sp. NPDC051023]|uniref:universal stress protein n=1 Tax=Streptosporangium sp. NPDC051023 TaxID=3155410 RepID=UPI00344D5686
MTETRDVVVGYDGSDFSMQALEWAMDEAELRKLPIVVGSCGMGALARTVTLLRHGSGPMAVIPVTEDASRAEYARPGEN